MLGILVTDLGRSHLTTHSCRENSVGICNDGGWIEPIYIDTLRYVDTELIWTILRLIKSIKEESIKRRDL